MLLLFADADAVVVGVIAALTAEKLMDYVRSVAVPCVAAAFLICDQRRRLEDRPHTLYYVRTGEVHIGRETTIRRTTRVTTYVRATYHHVLHVRNVWGNGYFNLRKLYARNT